MKKVFAIVIFGSFLMSVIAFNLGLNTQGYAEEAEGLTIEMVQQKIGQAQLQINQLVQSINNAQKRLSQLQGAVAAYQDILKEIESKNEDKIQSELEEKE